MPYKLNCGLEFDLSPAKLDASSDELIGLIQQDGHWWTDPKKRRDMFAALLRACAPAGVAEKACLGDYVNLGPQLDAMVGKAMGMEAPPADPTAPGAGGGGSGSAPASGAVASTPTA